MECVINESYCKSKIGAVGAALRVPAVANDKSKLSQENGIRFGSERVDQSVRSQKGTPESRGNWFGIEDKEEEEEDAGREGISREKSIGESSVGKDNSCDCSQQLTPGRLVWNRELLGLEEHCLGSACSPHDDGSCSLHSEIW